MTSPDTTTSGPDTRPREGWERGWPRPRGACTADVRNELGLSYGEREGRTFPTERRRPVPWLADQDRSGWDPWGFDDHRAADMRGDDLCQVCGGVRGDEVFAIAKVKPSRPREVEMYGGALCSLRCARLTAAVCPHYREQYPVHIWRVPKPAERVDYNGCGEDNDDEIDVTASGAVVVETRSFS